MRKVFFITLASVLLLQVIGCQKDISESNESDIPAITSNSSLLSPRLSYGDTLFFLKNQPGNYTIQVVSKPNSSGYFKSIPWGLALDTVTGTINISQSETGLRYKVYYFSTGGVLLDSTKLVVSGVDYKDAIFEIASTPNRYDSAFPIYNARPELGLPCPDDDDDDELCIFDETDLDNDGNDDIPGVIQDKLLIDIKKGTIDVEASFHAGIFGGSSPVNGAVRDFTFYYRLNDASNRALNKLTVRVYHYNTRNNIPQALLDTINFRNNQLALINSRTAEREYSVEPGRVSRDGVLNRIEGFSSFFVGPRRPPIIIIVSQ